MVLDSVRKGKIEVFPGRIMTISAQGIVQMPIESLLHILYILHWRNSAHRDLLAAFPIRHDGTPLHFDESD